ncbi:MAG: hypothetical protein J1E95_04400 [Muribaculaceae bacterium]|nr:hypothetical protein [Muribaculaceae bacterium]
MRTKYFLPLSLTLFLLACSDDDINNNSGTTDGVEISELPEWYYSGGELGTTFLSTSNAFEQPTKVIQTEGMYQSFKNGEALFEKSFNSNNTGVRHGLGPAYVRSSCIHCHPGYGHGKRQEDGTFNSNEIGNGYLLVVYDKDTEAYVPWLAGMPQSHAVAPFKSPVDENKINITWLHYTDEWGNKFPDGETYDLIYPEVNMPTDAVYVYNQGYNNLGNFGVKLESTIGIYGTGLLDAITDEDIVAEWTKQEKDGYMRNGLNTNYFENGQWKNFYTNTTQGGDGTPYIRRYTYAMSRGPLQDAAGANAFWNITNVTRSDRRFHYLDAAGTYAVYSSKDPEVQAGFETYIKDLDPKHEYPEFWEGSLEKRIYNYLTSKNLPVEVSDEEFTDLMVWHRGLAVPAVRNIQDPDVAKGKEIFEEIGCDYCHRPSWTTGEDVIKDPARFFKGDELPRYPLQTIWPYTDMVQHKLKMVNDIRTGWCRTTPLWGRGLHQKVTGSMYADRLHDCRARNVVEAIMWHGSSESDARYSVEKFRNLSKEERDALVKFIDAI